MAELVEPPKPAANITLSDCDKHRAMAIRDEIQKVRLWFSGWEAAGRSSPPGTDALRQMVIILDHSTDH